ncbi:MAG TPA: DUF2946 family protein [Burkholderiales bacterium]|nr:DUF2946 family protein [Burkholderiales bacterium]HYS74944.1 DUF2946 family protein [Burkholderiales bacterium]
MTTLRFRRRTAAWLALAGMALNAFWPLLADARPSVPALPLEICSATGLNKHSGDGVPPGAPGKGSQPSHCTLCPFNAERGAALPCATHALLASAPSDARHPAHSQAPRPGAAVYPTAPARAPPFLS